MQIKLIDDNNRFYIILENPEKVDKNKAIELVSKLFNINTNNEIKKSDLKPIKIEQDKVVQDQNNNLKTNNINTNVSKNVEKENISTNIENKNSVKEKQINNINNIKTTIYSINDFINLIKSKDLLNDLQKEKFKSNFNNFINKNKNVLLTNIYDIGENLREEDIFKNQNKEDFEEFLSGFSSEEYLKKLVDIIINYVKNL